MGRGPRRLSGCRVPLSSGCWPATALGLREGVWAALTAWGKVSDRLGLNWVGVISRTETSTEAGTNELVSWQWSCPMQGCCGEPGTRQPWDVHSGRAGQGFCSLTWPAGVSADLDLLHILEIQAGRLLLGQWLGEGLRAAARGVWGQRGAGAHLPLLCNLAQASLSRL